MKGYNRCCTTMAMVLWVVCLCGCGAAQVDTAPKAYTRPSLKILNIYPGNFDKDHMIGVLEAATGFELEFSYMSPENGAEKLKIEIASGTPYDLLRIYPWQFDGLALRGSLTDMTDLVYQYGSRILETTPKELWASTMLDGKIYGVPQKEMEYVDSAILARVDIFKKLNLTLPETTGELLSALRAVRSETELIPLSVSAPLVGTIASGFGIYDAHYAANEKTLVPMAEQAGMESYLTYMQKLYAEGLLDPNWPFNRTETLIQQFATGKAATIAISWEDVEAVVGQLEQWQPQVEVAVIQPLKGADRKQTMSVRGGVATVTCIPAASRYKVEATYFVNEFLKEDNFRFEVLGEQDRDYRFDGAHYMPVLPSFADNRFYSSGFLFGLDAEQYEQYWSECIVKKSPSAYAYYEAMQACAPDAKKSDPMDQAPILEKRAALLDSCEELLSQGYTELISGIRPMSEYKALVAEYRAAGGDEMLREAQTWYGGQEEK